ncbi:GNAT family N-acetyltransferase [Oceanihabitans sp. 2_MG-2023]|uniref:GNAT family N-acetyltransferase n=1 Tax=Oceanihabitans sp. 2_MG-2023 TaxID=3062661 RepID=UPI0026E1CC60|nr:GNAT family N-acetyltransferase [Oceanihabitans sp. 2_MG-2023]MDO6597151.1 GNAT family N-acetyltransferase [Oceanihabitans sp. 2_MG-2023]
MNIITATIDHIEALTPLFNNYRIFYKQASNPEAAKAFLKKRIENKDAVIFIAYLKEKAVGFTQLYPLYSSVSMREMYLLNDLYIDAAYRNLGIGEALINQAKVLCQQENNKGLAIQTAANNPAQNLYKRLGFKPDSDLHFFWKNSKV